MSGYLPGISRHPPGHHPLQVTGQTHSLHCDDGLLGQDGAEDRGGGGRISAGHEQTLCIITSFDVTLFVSGNLIYMLQ